MFVGAGAARRVELLRLSRELLATAARDLLEKESLADGELQDLLGKVRREERLAVSPPRPGRRRTPRQRGRRRTLAPPAEGPAPFETASWTRSSIPRQSEALCSSSLVHLAFTTGVRAS